MGSKPSRFQLKRLRAAAAPTHRTSLNPIQPIDMLTESQGLSTLHLNAMSELVIVRGLVPVSQDVARFRESPTQ